MIETVREAPVPGPVPRWEVPGWRERFGVVAGITHRGDGDEAFSLGLWDGQPVGAVMERWRRFRSAEPGFPGVASGQQVHRTELRWHDRIEGWLLVDAVDGHGTASPGSLLCVTVADCVPVYLVAPAQRAVVLLHAGWRGASAGILSRGVRLLTGSVAADVGSIVMHCGPSICGACYQVGYEVMDAFGLARPGAGPWRVDLAEQLAREAQGLGVRQISRSAWCTACHPEALHSHRASGGAAGRQIAYLGYPLSH